MDNGLAALFLAKNGDFTIATKKKIINIRVHFNGDQDAKEVFAEVIAQILQSHIKLLLLNMMAFCIAGEHQCQRTVAGHVACSSEAVLQCKDGKHQCSAGAVEFQYPGDDAKGCHDGSAGNTGSSDGKDAQKKAEQDHGARCGNRAVQDL